MLPSDERTGEEERKKLKKILLTFFSKNTRFIIETVIFAVFTIAIVIIFNPPTTPPIVGFKTETLLLPILIIGFYLIVSGRISELRIMDFEVKVSVATSKPLTEEKLKEEVQIEVETFLELSKTGETDRRLESETTTPSHTTPPQLPPEEEPGPQPATSLREVSGARQEGESDLPGPKLPRLHNVIVPQLIRENKKIHVLRIKKRSDNIYSGLVLYEYFKYFTYAVFLDENERFNGFAITEKLLNIINKDRGRLIKKLETNINKWYLDTTEFPILKDVYIVKGSSLKQVIDRMKELRLRVLPVVSTALKYEGIIDYDTVIFQITKGVITTDDEKTP